MNIKDINKNISKNQSLMGKIVNSTQKVIKKFFTSDFQKAVERSQESHTKEKEEQNNLDLLYKKALKASRLIRLLEEEQTKQDPENTLTKVLEISNNTYTEEEKLKTKLEAEEKKYIAIAMENSKKEECILIINNIKKIITSEHISQILIELEKFIQEFSKVHFYDHNEKDRIQYPLTELKDLLEKYDETKETNDKIIKFIDELQRAIQSYASDLLSQFYNCFPIT